MKVFFGADMPKLAVGDILDTAAVKPGGAEGMLVVSVKKEVYLSWLAPYNAIVQSSLTSQHEISYHGSTHGSYCFLGNMVTGN